MATVNKNFRIKNGLVVEGSTATVNGQNILTETGSDTYILNLIGGETLVKSVDPSDFKVSVSGELQIDSLSTLARTGDITSAINALDTDAIEEGSTNQYFTDTRAKMAVFGQDATLYDIFNSATTTNITASYIPTMGLTLTAENGVADSTTDDLTEGSTNLYFTDNRARAAVLGLSPSSSTYLSDSGSGYIDINTNALDNRYDAAGAASTAEGNANTYTDNAINALDTDDIEEGTTNKYFTDNRSVTAVSNVLGTGLQYVAGQFSVDTSTIATQSYVNDAIDNLVDGAPGLLDTLNEIAAAINDDANYFTTVTNAINAKQDALTAGSNIDISSSAGQLVISVTGLDTDDVAEGSNLYFTDARARDAVDGTDRSFTSVSINSVAKQIAATTGNITTAAATTAYSWAKADYRSGKFTVKVKNGSHTEISEILVTLDTSDNVAITEYGIVGTNGSLATVSADVSGSDVRIRVTPANDNSEVMVAGTLLI